MQRIVLPPLEARLQQRYQTMVHSHLRHAPELAAGIASRPDGGVGFAAVQGAWRFLHNERVSLPALVEPLRAAGRHAANASSAPLVLLVHDWSKLTFRPGRSLRGKKDLLQRTHATDLGYELTTALLVDAAKGQPLAPMELHVQTGAGVLSTRPSVSEAVGHLEQVLPTMNASRVWGLTKPLLHVIDREADSVDHYRCWHQAGHRFLVRADDRRVRWDGARTRLSAIAATLTGTQRLQAVGDVAYQGRPATLWVAETEVVLDRPAKKKIAGRSVAKPGTPLPLRLVVAQVRDAVGVVQATWLLLSNASRDLVVTEHLARCYYWRWRIESFFKLLKSHGQQLESWQQATGLAITRRLLVAAMACVVVWQLQADPTPTVERFKEILVRLSGRQRKRKHKGKPSVTASALLAGLGVLLPMLALLEQVDLPELKRLADQLPIPLTG